MADLRTSFIILEDVTSQAGVPLHKALEGDVAAGKNAHPALVAKDASNNLIYLRTDASGNLLTVSDANLAEYSAIGEVTGSASYVDVATVTLAAAKVYKFAEYICGCFRDAIFKIVWSDDGTPTDLVVGILCGAGDFTDSAQLKNLKFTTGATGVQQVKIQAKNLNALSDFRATLSIAEVQ